MLSAKAGILKIELQKYSLILCDIQLAEKNSFARLIEAAEALDKSQAIALMTGSLDQNDPVVNGLLELHQDILYLQKPFSMTLVTSLFQPRK